MHPMTMHQVHLVHIYAVVHNTPCWHALDVPAAQQHYHVSHVASSSRLQHRYGACLVASLSAPPGPCSSEVLHVSIPDQTRAVAATFSECQGFEGNCKLFRPKFYCCSNCNSAIWLCRALNQNQKQVMFGSAPYDNTSSKTCRMPHIHIKHGRYAMQAD